MGIWGHRRKWFCPAASKARPGQIVPWGFNEHREASVRGAQLTGARDPLEASLVQKGELPQLMPVARRPQGAGRKR